MIPVYQPWLTKLEKDYLNQAIDSKWISSQGYFIEKAEELFSDFIGVKHCALVSSGTTALHLCLKSINRINELVISPNTTFIATAFAASYDSSPLKFLDIDSETWNLNLDILENYLKCGLKIGVVIPVHLYGNPVDMERLLKLQSQYHFSLVEDACESLGASINGEKTGTFGDMSCFSFYGNKTFTCGEGGAIVTNNKDLHERAKLLRGQAQDPNKRYWHIDIGHNYRLTNMQAAILSAQLERKDEILSEKKRVADKYLSRLKDHFPFQKVLGNHDHSYWLTSLKLPVKQPEVSKILRENYKIDTRKIFYPVTTMPPYELHDDTPNSQELSDYGVSLPSYPELTDAQIDYICDSLLKVIHNDLST